MKNNRLNSEDIKYLIQNYKRYPIAIVRGSGSWVYDSNGKKYLDFTTGIAVNNLGHNNPAINSSIRKQLKKMVHSSNLFIIKEQIQFAKELVESKPGYKAFFCNSGTEANEAAFKLARKWGVFNGGRNKIISVTGAFHGRTLGSLSATSPKKYREGFYPLVSGFKSVAFNDIGKLKELVKKDKKIVAIVLEPIQGEAGVKFADAQYLKEVEALCKKKKILLILDEIQVGLGRTGKMYCHEHYKINPDIICLAKGLGGGLPCGAIIANPNIADFLTPGSHGTTMGGNPLAMSAGLSSLKQIKKKAFLKEVSKKGNLFLNELKKFKKNKYVKDIRGLGLILAIEFKSKDVAQRFSDLCLHEGLLVILTEKFNIRILPPLNVKISEIRQSIKIFNSIFVKINE